MKILQTLSALKEQDHRRALYASLVFIMLMILFFLLVSLEEPDPPLKEPVIPIELADVEIIEFAGAEEGGSPAPETGEPMSTESVETSRPTELQETSPVVTESGSDPESNANESGAQNDDPVDQSFSFGGGSGGDGNGNGTGFGDGEGVGGTGGGTGDGHGTDNPNRVMLKGPTFDKNTQEEGTIALEIYVDASGNVVRTKYYPEGSTSSSAYLKNLADKAARTMKFDSKPGAGLEKIGIKKFTFTKS